MKTLKVYAIFILLQTAVCVLYAAECPPEDDLSPCRCYNSVDDVDIELYCSGEDITLEQLKKALNAFTGQIDIGVKLNLLNLGTVPSNFFEGFDIKKIEISNSKLDNLAGGGGQPLEGLEHTLEKLIITKSFTEDNEPAKLTVSHLSNLREIVLSYNTITEVGNDWFQNAPSSLRRLTLNTNLIEVLGNRVFADIENLEYLALEFNRFGSVFRSMLPNPANELDWIRLNNNALTSIPEDFFSNIPYLRIVSLSSNGILKLPENTWKPVWKNLDNIDLRENPLECDSHMKWMIKVPTCAVITASCQAPRQKVGQKVPFIRDSNCAFYQRQHKN